MKKVSHRDFPLQAEALLGDAQAEHVVVTKNGRPFAMLIGLVNRDAEDLELMFDRSFWLMIQQRRKETVAIPLEEVQRELRERIAREAAERKPRKSRNGSKASKKKHAAA